MVATYIHELEDWPDFRWDANHLAALLAGTHRSQGRLIGRMESVGFALRSDAELQTLTTDVITTSAIEGEALDKAQVRSSVARQLGMDVEGLIAADRHVDGIVEMTVDATRQYKAPLSARRLFGWHAALFPGGRSGMTRIRVGRWRDDATGPMRVISGPVGRERIHFQAPEAGRLASEMLRFVDWFNRKDPMDPLLKAAIAHLWFVTVHPFDDGNGRIARAIADMALARSEQSPQRFYSMSAQIGAERKAYYEVLESTQKGDLDITPWLEWFLGCLQRAIEGTETTLANVLAKGEFWRNHAGMPFNERQRKVLNRILDGFEGKLTSSRWATLGKCSQDTASRDIDDLVRRGILVKDAAGGRSTSYSLVR
jgi:Fic family protein